MENEPRPTDWEQRLEMARPRTILSGTKLAPKSVAQLVYDTGWIDLEKLVIMVATIGAESLFYTEAVNEENPNGTIDYGLCQINSVHFDSGRFDFEKRFDPTYNVRCARDLYVSSSYTFNPWYAYKNGAYKKFLNNGAAGSANFMYGRLIGSPGAVIC
jgi:hypothetical protein